MELLLAFFIAFGVVNAKDASKLSDKEAQQLLAKEGLDKDYIIWEAEAGRFLTD